MNISAPIRDVVGSLWGRLLLAFCVFTACVVLQGGTAAAAPTATSITPNSAVNTGGDIVYISGSGFEDGATVTFGGVAAASVEFVNEESLVVTVPATNLVGPVDIAVRNPDNATSTLNDGFTFLQPAPVVYTVSPDKGPVAGGQTVTLTGDGFVEALQFEAVAGGGAHTCAIADGKPYCWGASNDFGQLGNGTNDTSLVPVAVDTSGVLADKTVTAISAKSDYTCAIADGRAYCWGQNANGQLGNNSTTPSNVPVAVDTSGVLADKTVTAIATGDFHACAIADGQAYCWGSGGSGRLGNNSTSQRLVPVAVNTSGVLSGKTVTAIAAGGSHTCAIADGQAYCWGQGNSGQLGNGGTSQSQVPVAVNTSGVLSGKTVTAIAAGSQHSCAVATGAAYCWGINTNGRLGDNSTTQRTSPVAVNTSGVLSGKTVTAIATGPYSSCAIAQDQAYCWGRNNFGQLGNNSTTESLVPVAVDANGVLAGKTVTDISATGTAHTCVIADESVHCWGINNGRLGNGATAQSLVPTTVSPLSVFLTLTIGGITAEITEQSATTLQFTTPAHAAGLVDIELTADYTETLVLESSYEYLAPPTISGVMPNTGFVNGGDIVVVSGNNFHENAVVSIGGVNATVVFIDSSTLQVTIPPRLTAGSVSVVVTNPDDQGDILFNTYTYMWPAPVVDSVAPDKGPAAGGQTVTLTGEGFVSAREFDSVGVGNSHTCAIADGQAYCWGLNANGQLGSGSNTDSTVPVAVDTSGVLAGKTVTAISAGNFHTCAIADGQAYCWGSGNNGQLGNGSNTDSTVPVAVSTAGVLSGKTVTAISVGNFHTCAIADGQAYCWGSGNNGQLGNGSNTDSTVPVVVSTAGVLSGKTVTAIATGSGYTCAIADGRAYCWGSGSAGRLGNGTNDPSNVPVAVNTAGVLFGKTVTDIAVGAVHVCAIANGQAYCWGMNTNGKLGDGTTNNSNVPVAVSTSGVLSGKTVTVIAGGGNHTCAIADGQAYCWGNNANGQFGNASNESSLVPVEVYSTIIPFILTIGGNEAVITEQTETTLKFTTPAHDPGYVDIELVADYAETVLLEDAYFYYPVYAFTNDPLSLMATEPGQLTLETQDGEGNPFVVPMDITLQLSSTSASGFFAKALDGPDSGWDVDSITIPAGQSSVSFYYKDNDQGTPTITAEDESGQQVTQDAAIGSRYKLLVTGVTDPTNAGIPSSVTVQAVDYTGVAQSDYLGTIVFSSDDGAAILPASYTFKPEDHGRHTFVNGVTFGTEGVWDVVATDQDNPNITGAQEGIVVGSPPAGTIAQLKFITAPQSFPVDKTSGVITVQTQDVGGTPIPVLSNTTIYLRSNSLTGEFSVDGGDSWSGAPTEVVITSGTSSVNVLYRDSSMGMHELKVSQNADNDFGWTPDTQNIVVGVGDPAKLAIEAVSSAYIGAWIPVSVKLVDSVGNAVTSPSDITVSVSASDGAQLSLLADGSNAASSLDVMIATGMQSVVLYISSAAPTVSTVQAVDDRPILDEAKLEPADELEIVFMSAEATQLTFVGVPSKVAVNTPLLVQVSLADSFGNVMAADEPVTVTITSNSSDTEFATSPSGPWQASRQVTIGAGNTSASIYFRHASVNLSVGLQAVTDGLDPANTTIEVTAGAYQGKLRFKPAVLTSVTAGEGQAFTIELLDQWDNPTIASSTVTLGLGGTNTALDGGNQPRATWDDQGVTNPQDGDDPVYTVEIPAGKSEVTAVYRDTLAGNTTITAWDQDKWSIRLESRPIPNWPYTEMVSVPENTTKISHNLTVLPAAPAAFEIISSEQIIAKNTPSAPVVVRLLDEFGNVTSFPSSTGVQITADPSGELAQSANGPWNASTVTFTAGASQAQFYFRHGTAGQYTLEISGGGLTGDTQSIRVVEGFAEKLLFDAGGVTTVVAGDVLSITVKTAMADNTEVTVLTNTNVTLSGQGGEFSLTADPFTPIGSAVIAAETSSVQLYYRSQSVGIKQLTALAAGLADGTYEVSVNPDDFYALDFTEAPQRVEVTKPSTQFVATAFDMYGNVAVPDTNAPTTVAINSSHGSGEFAVSPEGSWDVGNVSIAAGATTTEAFYYRNGTIDAGTGALTDSSVLGNQTITAHIEDVQDGTAVIDIVGLLAEKLVFLSDPQVLTTGESSAKITVQLQLEDGTPAVVTGDRQIALSTLELDSDSPFGAKYGDDIFSLTADGEPVTQVTVPAGSSKAEFYVRPRTAGQHRLKASSVVQAHTGGTLRTVAGMQEITVLAGPPAKLSFTSTSQTIRPDEVSAPIKITLGDQFGNPVTEGSDRTITLETSCGTGAFLDAPDGNEITEITLFAANSNVFVYYRDSAALEDCILTAKSGGLEDATQSIAIRDYVHELHFSSAPQVIEAGEVSAQITVVTRDRFGNVVPAESPIGVQFSAPGNVTITPTNTTIGAGSSQAQFTIRYNDPVTSAKAVTMTAAHVGGMISSATQDITIVPGDPAKIVWSQNQFTADVGDMTPMTVGLRNSYEKTTVANGDLVINLSTSAGSGTFYSDNAGTTVITSVTIPNGQTKSPTFYYRQTQTTQIQPSGGTPATLTASRVGLTSAVQQATIYPRRLTFSTGSFSALAGEYVAMRVQIDKAISSSITVNLSTSAGSGGFYSSKDEDSLITSITIAAGQNQSAEFYYRQTQSTGGLPAMLTASASLPPVSVWSNTATASLYTGELYEIVFTQTSSPLEQNQPGIFRVEARDNMGNTTPFTTTSGGMCLYVGVDSTQATVSGTAGDCTDSNGRKAIKVDQLATNVTFSYRDMLVGSRTLTVSTQANGGGIAVSAPVTITPAQTARLVFDPSSYALIRGDVLHDVTVKLLSQYGIETNSLGDVEVTLSSGSASALFQNPNTGDWEASPVITIPSGQTSVSFSFRDDAISGSSSLNASAAGLTNGNGVVKQVTGDVAGIAFVTSPQTLELGEMGTFTVRLVDGFGNETAVAQPLCFYATTSVPDPQLTGIPSPGNSTDCRSVELPDGTAAQPLYFSAGMSRADFTLASLTATGNFTVQVHSQSDGSGLGAQQELAIVAGAPTGITFSRDRYTMERGGIADNLAIIVRNAQGIEVPADDPINLTLSTNALDGQFTTSLLAPWQSPLNIVIPAGVSRVPLLYGDTNPQLGEFTITAEDNDMQFDPAEAVVEIVPGEGVVIGFITPERTTTATHPSQIMTVELQNQYGYPAPASSDIRLYMRSSSPTGEFAAQTFGSWGLNFVQILRGQTSADFYYRDKAEGVHTITAKDSLSNNPADIHYQATQQHTIERQVFSHFLVTNISTPQQAGLPSSVVVFAMDSENYVVEWYNGTITFSADSPDAVYPTYSYTFVPEIDHGIHTFTNSIAFKLPGIKAITVTDENGHSGTQYDIQVLGASTAAVQRLVFIAPVPLPTETSVSIPTIAFTVQLRDLANAPTVAQDGDFPIRFMSSSAGGLFATDLNGPWTDMLEIVVEEGLSFSTTPVYYRDTRGGTHTITAADWQGGIDDVMIINATGNVIVHDLEVVSSLQTYGLDYTGTYIPNRYLFARSDSGAVAGYVRANAEAHDPATGNVLVADWNVKLTKDGGLVDGASYPSAASLLFVSNVLEPAVASSSYTVRIEATSAGLGGVSTHAVDVSPWLANIDINFDADTQTIPFSLMIKNDGLASDPDRIMIQIVTGDNQPVDSAVELDELLANGVAAKSAAGQYSVNLPRPALSSGVYKVAVTAMDNSAAVLAQDTAQFTVASTEEPIQPPVPGEEEEIEPPAIPDEPADSGTQPDDESNSGSGLTNWLRRWLSSPVTSLAVPGVLVFIIILIGLALLYQACKEWRQARWLLAAAKRKQKEAEDKRLFIDLVQHHLRTPITMIRSSLELLEVLPDKPDTKLLQTLRDVSANLHAKSEQIVAKVSQSPALKVIEMPTVEQSRTLILRSPLFWLPIVLAAAVTVVLNLVIRLFDLQTISGQTMVLQLVVLCAGGIVLYIALRSRAIQTKRRQIMAETERDAAEMAAAEAEFVIETENTLKADVAALSAQDVGAITQPIAHKSITDGIDRLNRLIERFAILRNNKDAMPVEKIFESLQDEAPV